MKTYQMALLERALQLAAEDFYYSEIVQTESEDDKIGTDLEYESREAWLEERVEDWLEKAAMLSRSKTSG